MKPPQLVSCIQRSLSQTNFALSKYLRGLLNNMEWFMLAGVAAPVWMFMGVIWVSSLYPNYSHRHNVMSELGAKNRPTTKIHPIINNFPIGILFILFGLAVSSTLKQETLPLISGVLIIIHGACHIITGIFPCDENLGIENPSASQKTHNLAGLIMFFSLWFACFVWIFSDMKLNNWFEWYSVISALTSFSLLKLMLEGLKTGVNLGLHQRTSYAVLAIWAGVLSFLLS